MPGEDEDPSTFIRYYDFDPSIPQLLYDIFTDGLQFFDKSVSGVFDIQWRTYNLPPNKLSDYNGGKIYQVGGYRQLGTFVLEDKIELVEGLIVDSSNGGIGFRNHSIPSEQLTYGGEWSEDILFVIPETECVNTNISLDFPLPDTVSDAPPYLVLTDRGGFAHLDTHYKWRNSIQNNGQDTLNLRDRAYLGAWLNNVLTMELLNVTDLKLIQDGVVSYLDSTVGKEYPFMQTMPGYNYSWGNSSAYNTTVYTPGFQSIESSSGYGDYFLNLLGFNGSAVSNLPNFPNPFNVTSDKFNAISGLCSGSRKDDYANISNIGVACGTFTRSARPVNWTGEIPLSFPPGANWTQSLFSCASATKAVLKTVTFKYNGTGDFSGLSIINLTDKIYDNDDEKPLWVVEHADRDISIYTPLWGMTSPKYQSHPNISTLRKEFLWLPGEQHYFTEPYDSGQNLPALNFHMIAFSYNYFINPGGNLGSEGIFDYSGVSQEALYQKWFQLSSDAAGSANILNLVWTDLVANALVGMRGWASQSKPILQATPNLAKRASNKDSGALLVPVYLYKRRVLFKYQYGIPGFLVCAVGLALAAGVIVLACLRRVSIPKLRKYLELTSFGLGVASLLYPESISKGTSKPGAGRCTAKKQIILGGERPLAAEETNELQPDETTEENQQNTDSNETSDLSNGRETGSREAEVTPDSSQERNQSTDLEETSNLLNEGETGSAGTEVLSERHG